MSVAAAPDRRQNRPKQPHYRRRSQWLLEVVLVQFDDVVGLADLDADAVLDHQPRQAGAVDEGDAGRDVLGIWMAAVLNRPVVMNTPWPAWWPWSAPTKP